jgi:hypothetical protein
MEAPQPYKTAGLLNLVGGLFNITTGLVWTLSLLLVCVGVFWIVPMAMGAFQLFIGIGMQSGKLNGNAKLATIMGIVAGVLNFNPVTIILSVIAYMQLGDPEVAGFLEQTPS